MKRLCFALIVAIPDAALAQMTSCRLPDQIILPEPRPGAARSQPSAVDGYTLALSWSPEYCRDFPGDDSEQCRPRTGRFGFILHGLWPETSGRTAPRWCVAQRPLTVAVVRQHFCATPSTRLIAHEWAKHGTCAARDPADYFAAARKLFTAVRIPDMDALSRRAGDVGGFKRLFLSLNPAITPSSLVVVTDRKGWLDEIRICLNKQMRTTRCARDRPRGAASDAPLRIWRGRA